jgi:hypothetical protein
MLVSDLKGNYPPYFIYGPLVFTKVSYEFLAFLNSKEKFFGFGYVRSPLVVELGDSPDENRDELVAISAPFFPHQLSKGYGNPAGTVVYSINGVRVRSLRHLVTLLRDLKDEFVKIELDNRGGEAFVFPRKEMLDSTDEIMNDNGVRAQGDADSLMVWQGKRPNGTAPVLTGSIGR